MVLKKKTGFLLKKMTCFFALHHYPLYMLLPLSLALFDDSPEMYNSDFTMHELTDSLSRLKNTSHGHDQVYNKHLENHAFW